MPNKDGEKEIESSTPVDAEYQRKLGEDYKATLKEHGRKQRARYSDDEALKVKRCKELISDLALSEAVTTLSDFEKVRAKEPNIIKHLIEVQLEQRAELTSYPPSVSKQAKKQLDQERRDTAKAIAAIQRRIVAENLKRLKEEAGFTHAKLADLLGSDIPESTVVSHTQFSECGRCPADRLLCHYAKIYTVALGRAITVEWLTTDHLTP